VAASDGLYLPDTRADVLEKSVPDGMYLLDRRSSGLDRYALDKAFVADTAVRVLEKVVRDGTYVADVRVQALERLLRDGAFLRDTLQRIEEHGVRDGLYAVDAAQVQRVRQLLAQDGLYLSDAAVADLLVAGGQLFAVAVQDALLLGDTVSRETPGVLAFAAMRALDWLGVVPRFADVAGGRARTDGGWVAAMTVPAAFGVRVEDGRDLLGAATRVGDLLGVLLGVVDPPVVH